jgi:hypothetical protein
VTIKLIRRKGRVTLRIDADEDEGIALKDAAVAMGKVEVGNITRLFEVLKERGYTAELSRETRMSKTFHVAKGTS